jgi:hypothetical protein
MEVVMKTNAPGPKEKTTEEKELLRFSHHPKKGILF